MVVVAVMVEAVLGVMVMEVVVVAEVVVVVMAVLIAMELLYQGLSNWFWLKLVFSKKLGKNE